MSLLLAMQGAPPAGPTLIVRTLMGVGLSILLMLMTPWAGGVAWWLHRT